MGVPCEAPPRWVSLASLPRWVSLPCEPPTVGVPCEGLLARAWCPLRGLPTVGVPCDALRRGPGAPCEPYRPPAPRRGRLDPRTRLGTAPVDDPPGRSRNRREPHLVGIGIVGRPKSASRSRASFLGWWSTRKGCEGRVAKGHPPKRESCRSRLFQASGSKVVLGELVRDREVTLGNRGWAQTVCRLELCCAQGGAPI